jgi:hypothetical protein
VTALSAWQDFYDSAWHHPAIAWAGSGFAVWAMVRSKCVPWGLSLGLALEILIDAWFTGALAPKLGTSASTAATVLFVILGDARFFLAALLLASSAGSGAPLDVIQARAQLRAPALRSAGLALLIPLIAYGAKTFLPWVPDLRRMFLLYEGLFAVLAASLYFGSARAKGWARAFQPVRKLALFQCAQYTCWVIADILILLGYDFGHGFRLLPNTLYYVAFVPVAIHTLDAALEAQRRPRA